jgi:NAD(P)-dependent dehydrogenase (short-subunit alcohol dehydrogenase family)
MNSGESTMDILKGKGAVVTGAASGIGKAIAAAFIEAGASVLLCDLNAKALDDAARDLGNRAIGRLPTFRTRVRSKAQCAQLGRLSGRWTSWSTALDSAQLCR